MIDAGSPAPLLPAPLPPASLPPASIPPASLPPASIPVDREHALELLSQKGVVNLDEERKAAMVCNLLVVLCSEHATQPVVNTGTLHP